MNWIVYLFGGGLVVFIGAGLIAAAVGLASVIHGPWRGSVSTLLALLGLLLVAASATPWSIWLYLLSFSATFWWLVAERWDRLEDQRGWARAGVLFVWIVLVALELPYQFQAAPAAPASGTITIFGDSVTAGMGDDRVRTWPKLLVQQHGLLVQDHSAPGATTHSMAAVAARSPPADGVVIVEIGGNDLLSGGSASDFERELDTLLAAVAGPGRTVILLELPLPPLCNAYGAAQRSLAAKHGVVLLPRRLFAEILAAGGLTIDSIHLSPQGHERMADLMAAARGR